MNAEKFQFILEDQCDDPAKLSGDVLLTVCRMYLSDIGPECLPERVSDVLANGTKMVAHVVEEVCEGTSEKGRALRDILVENAPKDVPAPSSETLSTLMNKIFEDDDEDDYKDGDDKKTEKKGAEPVLRGILKNKDGKLFWIGKWAISKEKFDLGQKSKFRMQYMGKENSSDPTCPPSNGKWSGYFLLSTGLSTPPSKIEERGVTLRFGDKTGDEGWISVTGEGSNQFGDFTISGLFDAKSCRLSIVKTYKAPDNEWEGGSDEESEEDELEDDDAGAVADEIALLKADAEEDIEVLKKRMQGVIDGEVPTKKAKIDEEVE